MKPKSYQTWMKRNNSTELRGYSFNNIYGNNGSPDPLDPLDPKSAFCSPVSRICYGAEGPMTDFSQLHKQVPRY